MASARNAPSFIRLSTFLFVIPFVVVGCEIETKEGVKIEIIIPPPTDCRGVKEGDWVQVLYNMTSLEGKLIDSTYRPDGKIIAEEYYFAVGVTNGVTIGLEGGCKGEKRRLTIPGKLMRQVLNMNWVLLNKEYIYLHCSLYITVSDSPPLLYEALIVDHVPVQDKHCLVDFWSTDLNADKVIDLEEVDEVLLKEEFLKSAQLDINVENLSDWIMSLFDKDGDSTLDREEYFDMLKTIRLDEMVKAKEESLRKEKELEEMSRKRRRRNRIEL
ncbi:uncharacterized protein LOC133173569 [Saccostrea echinata]|uniref:uncharacterized protein LOC133173569 n=1 Tax=Saccostrea echinata TaxID=191078 RepID=UPI002A80250A|nr:uncharacterized protein LOC133173569 [Saccostrea echinata]